MEYNQRANAFEFTADVGMDPATVYPLVGDSGNRQVLTDWLADHESYRIADDSTITENECDLYIVDQAGFERHRDELSRVKSEAEPVLLPVLLLVSEWQSDVARHDRGEVADNVFVATVDELVSTPIRQVELEWRMSALLRLREQSLELRAKQERLRVFRRAAEAAGHGIYITDSEGVIDYVNPAFEEITGYSREEVLGETPGLLNSGEMPSEHFDELWETVSAGETWEGELIGRRTDGERYVAYQTVAPIPGNDGEMHAFVTVLTDITERKESARKLERHRNIVERLDDPIMLQNREGDFELLNEAVADYAGVPAADLLGEDEFRFMDEETAARIARRKSEVFEAEEPVEYRVTPTFEPDDRDTTFSTTRYPYYDPDGELIGTVAICQDVTDLDERTRQLEVIDTVLRHNLRNSLTAIGLLAEQLRSRTDGELAETADSIVQNAQELRETGEKSRAITSVLADPPTREPVDVTDVIQSLADTVEKSHSGAQLTVETPENTVVSATFKIGDAFEELVKNALTHSGQNGPSIELRVETHSDEVVVSVIDDGPGMSEMNRDVLERGVATEDLYHGGGLGLWLVYWIVSRSGGTITVSDSEPGGTEVNVTLSRYTPDGTG